MSNPKLVDRSFFNNVIKPTGGGANNQVRFQFKLNFNLVVFLVFIVFLVFWLLNCGPGGIFNKI